MNSGESSQFGKCGFGSLHNLTRVFHRGFSEFSLNNVFKLIDITGGTISFWHSSFSEFNLCYNLNIVQHLSEILR